MSSERDALRGRRVLITGGTAGIGRAAAQLAIARGARVAIAARGAAGGDLRDAVAIAMDVTDDASVTRGVEMAHDALGGLDVVINNAGAAHPGEFDTLAPAVFHQMMELNYFGMVRVTRAALPALRASRGRLAFVSSMLGFMGLHGYSAYAPSKHAIAGFAECLRQELAPDGVGVSLCFPPTTETPGLVAENRIKPAATWAVEGASAAHSAESVAAALLDGIARGRFEILVGAESRWIWRAQRFAPWLVRRGLDYLLARHRRVSSRSRAR